MSRYTDHKYANKILKSIDQNPEKYFLIHYSCESFVDIQDGRTPRITSIAIKSILTGQVESFSMHKTAELSGVPTDKIVEKYDDIEREMLRAYFSFIKENKNMYYLHINMRDINFGFKAIEHRGKVLGLKIFSLNDSQKIDFADLLKKRYGNNYIGHPRMESLCEKNGISTLGFLSGKDEAAAFKNHHYVKLHQSTLAKVEMYTNLLKFAINNKLATNSKWYDIYGISIQGIIAYIKSKWWLQLIAWIISTTVSIVIGFYLEKCLH